MSFEFEFELPSASEGPPEFDKIERQDERGQKKQVVVRIDYDLCDNSAACTMVCPEDVLDAGKGHPIIAKPEACTECWICVENCGSGAIDIG